MFSISLPNVLLKSSDMSSANSLANLPIFPLKRLCKWSWMFSILGTLLDGFSWLSWFSSLALVVSSFVSSVSSVVSFGCSIFSKNWEMPEMVLLNWSCSSDTSILSNIFMASPNSTLLSIDFTKISNTTCRYFQIDSRVADDTPSLVKRLRKSTSGKKCKSVVVFSNMADDCLIMSKKRSGYTFKQCSNKSCISKSLMSSWVQISNFDAYSGKVVLKSLANSTTVLRNSSVKAGTVVLIFTLLYINIHST